MYISIANFCSNALLKPTEVVIFSAFVKISKKKLLEAVLMFNTSQGSVATQLWCDEIFNNHFIVSCTKNVAMKKF